MKANSSPIRTKIRACFSQERMTYIPEESKVVYQSKDGNEEKIFDALEWLAAMCSHVPKKGKYMVLYNTIAGIEGVEIWGTSPNLGSKCFVPPLSSISLFRSEWISQTISRSRMAVISSLRGRRLRFERCIELIVYWRA